MAAEERACRREGLEGGREWGLWEPSLSLPWLLGGVGGSCSWSSVGTLRNWLLSLGSALMVGAALVLASLEFRSWGEVLWGGGAKVRG